MTWSFKLPLVSWRECKEVDEDLEMELVEVEKVEVEKVEELEEWSVWGRRPCSGGSTISHPSGATLTLR